MRRSFTTSTKRLATTRVLRRVVACGVEATAFVEVMVVVAKDVSHARCIPGINDEVFGQRHRLELEPLRAA